MRHLRRCPILFALLSTLGLTDPAPAAAELTTAGAVLLHQEVPGLLGGTENGDFFGSAVASGDFNGDGFDDLAIGVPGDRVGTADGAGVVWTIPGSPAGLDLWASRAIHQDSPGVPGVAEAGDGFGGALGVGDFDGDGFDDLAVGAPHEDVGSVADAGAAWVFFGSATGLATAGARSFDISVLDAFGLEPATGDKFGFALAAGNFCDLNGAGRDSLAIGVPGFEFGNSTRAGTSVLLCSRDAALDKPVCDLHDPMDTGTQQGYAMASGDIDGDGLDELAVGAPGDGSGSVTIEFGRADRFPSGPRTVLSNPSGSRDRFGSSVAIADFDADGFADVAIGIAGEAIGSASAAGSIVVYDGADLPARRVFFSQNEPASIAGVSEMSDNFGAALAAGDFDGDGYADLAIGVAHEDLGSVTDAGMFHVLFGGPSGLAASRSQAFDQSLAAVPETADAADFFGWALAAGDFDGDGAADLAVGVPREEITGRPADHGAVSVFFGQEP